VGKNKCQTIFAWMELMMNKTPKGFIAISVKLMEFPIYRNLHNLDLEPLKSQENPLLLLLFIMASSMNE
jgi:hypothetical protein